MSMSTEIMNDEGNEMQKRNFSGLKGSFGCHPGAHVGLISSAHEDSGFVFAGPVMDGLD